jgi:hypothetical protein
MVRRVYWWTNEASYLPGGGAALKQNLLIGLMSFVVSALTLYGQAPTPLTLTVVDRQRTNATQWFEAPPFTNEYGHVDSLLRLGLQKRMRHFDWQIEMGQNAELFLPGNAVSSNTAQGQLGLGGTYFAANTNNAYPAAASLRSAFLRYHFKRDANTLRLGRFEFFDGMETAPKDTTLAWLQSFRVAQRLIGNFGFANAQRSFDGIDGKVGGTNWDVTAMAGRAVQGVFNMNANPEINADAQYLAYSRCAARQHVLVRGFAIDYHDGRTGVTKTDNRPLAVRQVDHKNIRIGTYGASAIAAIPAGKNTFDLLFWGALQNGQWGVQDHRAGGVAVEGGLRLNNVASKPWLRGGFLRTTGDNNPSDNRHTTFFQVLPTPRNYARFPFFNMMNSSEQFIQLIDKPTSKLDLRTDLHFLHLTSGSDLWYQGGGAFDNKVFGFTGRPGNGHSSFTSLYDISADYAFTKQLSLSAYYSRVVGKSVIAAIYPAGANAQYGFLELNYKFSHPFVRTTTP